MGVQCEICNKVYVDGSTDDNIVGIAELDAGIDVLLCLKCKRKVYSQLLVTPTYKTYKLVSGKLMILQESLHSYSEFKQAENEIGDLQRELHNCMVMINSYLVNLLDKMKEKDDDEDSRS